MPHNSLRPATKPIRRPAHPAKGRPDHQSVAVLALHIRQRHQQTGIDIFRDLANTLISRPRPHRNGRQTLMSLAPLQLTADVDGFPVSFFPSAVASDAGSGTSPFLGASLTATSGRLLVSASSYGPRLAASVDVSVTATVRAGVHLFEHDAVDLSRTAPYGKGLARTGSLLARAGFSRSISSSAGALPHGTPRWPPWLCHPRYTQPRPLTISLAG